MGKIDNAHILAHTRESRSKVARKKTSSITPHRVGRVAFALAFIIMHCRPKFLGVLSVVSKRATIYHLCRRVRPCAAAC
jgi:hypothetical protein